MAGTGKWTVQDAAEIGVAVPTIAAAVVRELSESGDRQKGSQILPGLKEHTRATKQLVDTCERLCRQVRQLRACMQLIGAPAHFATGTWIAPSWRASGKPAASSAPGFSDAFRRRTSATPTSRACCSIRVVDELTATGKLARGWPQRRTVCRFRNDDVARITTACLPALPQRSRRSAAFGAHTYKRRQGRRSHALGRVSQPSFRNEPTSGQLWMPTPFAASSSDFA
jgi:hypothetical protein